MRLNIASAALAAKTRLAWDYLFARVFSTVPTGKLPPPLQAARAHATRRDWEI